MGKSPGKWIKTVLFGKKASRSNSSKGRDVSRSANEKEAQVAADAPAAEFSSSLSMSQPVSITNDQCAGNSEFEQGLSSNAPCNVPVLVPLSQDADEQGSILSEAPNDPDRIRREEAATKAQAAFRGYLARRAFWALKGIIRLQALARGHLVRRQAIATLRCIRGIVKLQALVRGQKIRLRDSGVKGLRKCYLGKFQIIASSSSAMPLCLEYGPGEPNSAWSWLERWTSSRIWEPSPETRKAAASKSQEKQENFQRLEIETGRSKRSVRRVPAANLDNVSTSSIPEFEKPKRSVRKVWSNPVDSMQEPQNELEKVKRNLRKVVSNSGMETTDQVEVRTEKPHHNLTEASGSSAPDVPDQAIGEPAERAKTDSLSKPASKHLDIEITPKSIAQEEVVHVLHDDQSVVGVSTLKSSEKDDIMHEVDEVSKENQTSNVNQKTSRRKVSPPVKQQEYPENGVQHTPKLPSYMAATESAKAKLRGQGSPRSGPVAEQNDLTRRHSLPSPANCKLNAFSPRTQRIVQNGGKGGVKNDKSLPSSRDGNEKAEWRR